MSEELTPEPSAELLVNNDANQSVPAPLVPAAPQFSSRREMRAALESKPTEAPKSLESPAKPVYSKPKTKRVHLSLKDRALARKLAVAPSVAASAPRSRPSTTRLSARRKKQNPLKAAFVLLVISAFVGGIALPSVAATANAGGTQSFETTAGAAQGFKSTATIVAPAAGDRDEISATSEAELRAEQITAKTLASPTVGKRQPGDDYPWRTAGYGLSPLNYYYRQCVDFVAWRLNRDAGVTSAPWKWTWSTLTPNGGDASQWKAAWEAHGWKTSATPVVGSVAWFVGNHVAYVNAVKGSNVVIEEYNGTSSRAYAMRTIPSDTVGRFLYPPPS